MNNKPNKAVNDQSAITTPKGASWMDPCHEVARDLDYRHIDTMIELFLDCETLRGQTWIDLGQSRTANRTDRLLRTSAALGFTAVHP